MGTERRLLTIVMSSLEEAGARKAPRVGVGWFREGWGDWGRELARILKSEHIATVEKY